jgi:hypothetical protein
VLGIVYRCIATHLIKKAGFSRKTAQAGAVTLIQRVGSALNLNVHFHWLCLDGGISRIPMAGCGPAGRKRRPAPSWTGLLGRTGQYKCRGRQKAGSDHQPAGALGKAPVAHDDR